MLPCVLPGEKEEIFIIFAKLLTLMPDFSKIQFLSGLFSTVGGHPGKPLQGSWFSGLLCPRISQDPVDLAVS